MSLDQRDSLIVLRDATPPPRAGWVRVEGKRGDLWQRNTGTRVFPVLNTVPDLAAVFGAEHLVYQLDWGRCDRKVQDKIAHFLGERFNRPAADIAYEINNWGCPILATDCVLADQP